MDKVRKSTSPPNLPKLRQNHGLSMPAAPGDWGPPGNLRALAEALAVEAEGMRLQEIKSVPHVWGHAILFESALLNESHPAHKDAVGHWRALLAMLALRKFDPSYSLISRALKLDQAASGKRAEQAFAHVAGRETLDPKICPNSDWYLLYRSLGAEEKGEQEVLVGMLSPSTIVAPARNFAAEDFFGNDDLGGQYWASAKHGLRDPLAGEGKLSYDEIWVCQSYVANLSTAVQKQDLETRRESDDSEAAKARLAYLHGIASRLEQFHEDLKREGEGRHFVEWKKDDDQDLVTDDDDVVPRVYRAVNAVWKEADRAADAIVTDLKLGELVLDSGKTITLVLADWRCADSLERLPKRVSLFSKRTLADLPRPTPDGAPGPIPSYLREEAADQDILLLSPNDLLSDCLTDLKAFQSSHHPKQFSTKLLPIKPAALLLFPKITGDSETTGDLEALVSKHLVLRGSKSEPRVALEVTLTSTLNQSGGKEEKRKHQVSRKYRTGTTSTREEAYAPGALAAWPNFQMTSSDSGWKWNYLFTMTNVSSSPEDRSVVATSGISRSMLLRDLRQLGHVKDLKARLGRWSSDQGRWTELSGIEVQGNDDPWFEWLRMCSRTGQDPTEKSLQRSDTAFEAALFRLPSPDGDSVYAGLGILPPSPTLSTQDAEAGGGAQIACDFGTSNTIVYYKRAGRKSEPLDFQPRLRRFNHYREEDGSTVEWDREYSKFMPTESVNQPFSTVLEIRSADGVADLVEEWRNAKEPALWRDHAFFDPDVLNLTESLLLSKEGGANLVFDLKWNTKQEARERMGRYLRHITMLSLAEVSARDGQAPSDVYWHFSYPISMHEPDDYRNVIKLEALNNLERKNDVVFHTESQATFNYFKGMDETDPTAMLVLDIGGGSTDILLWRRGSEHGTMVWQHSLRLAGDHLMTEFLVHNREFLDGLGIAAIGRRGGHGVFGDEESLDKFMNPPTDQRPGTVDRNVARAIINSPLFGSAFEKKWFTMRKTKAPLRLQAGAWAMMGGLIWFLGLQTEALLNRKRSALVREDLKTMKLCFGGRGSTLFKLLSQNNEAFKAMTLRVTEHASTVKSYFSKDMKHEAAKGMLAESLARLESGGTNLCVLGVGATLGADASVDANTFIHDVKASLALAANEKAQRTDRDPAVAVEEFVAVVEEAVRLGGLQITFKPEAMQTITIAGQEAIAKLLRLGDEPPYIAMLRKTLSLIYEGKSIEVDWQAQRT